MSNDEGKPEAVSWAQYEKERAHWHKQYEDQCAATKRARAGGSQNRGGWSGRDESYYDDRRGHYSNSNGSGSNSGGSPHGGGYSGHQGGRR